MEFDKSVFWSTAAAFGLLLLSPACGSGADRSKAVADASSMPDASTAKDGSAVKDVATTPLVGYEGGLLPDNVEPTRIPLPPRPMWNPDVPLGGPGWRQSIIPFCSEDVAGLDARIWSNGAAVYVSVASNCAIFDAPMTCNWATTQGGAVTVYKNDGTGWTRIYRHSTTGSSAAPITGYPDGRIVLLNADCPVRLVQPDGTGTCIWTGGAQFQASSATVTPAGSLFVAGTGDSTSSAPSELWQYDGGAWTKSMTSTDALAWANGFLVGYDNAGTLWVRDPTQEGGVTSISGVPLGIYTTVGRNFYGLWTYGASESLLATAMGGLAHYDGVQWVTLDTGLGNAITRLWGASDRTMFGAARGPVNWFGRWGAGVVSQIFASASVGVTDIFGNSSTEVFVSVGDPSLGAYTCGGIVLLWFDGTVFHPF